MRILNITYPNSQIEYINNIIKEEFNALLESRKTEELATNALTKNNIADVDNLVNQFKEIDKTKNQILLPGLAKAYIEHPNINDLKGVFEFIGEKLNDKKIKQFVASKKGYALDDKQFSNWLDLSGHIHQQQTAEITDSDDNDVVVKGSKPFWENDKFAVYDGRKKGNCVEYGEGGISGKNYSFCIGNPGGGMHQSYRDDKASTFWYVFDKTKELSDPLHIVVVNAVDPKFAEQQGYNAPYELTDYNNVSPPTKIAEFGSDVQAYINYLKQQGVPVEKILPHNPHSEDEKIALELLKQKNPNLDWFKSLGKLAHNEGLGLDQDLTKLTYKLQSQYIGRGHSLSDEQFMYLWHNRKNVGAFTLLKQLVNTGMPLPESQFNVLVGQENG